MGVKELLVSYFLLPVSSLVKTVAPIIIFLVSPAQSCSAAGTSSHRCSLRLMLAREGRRSALRDVQSVHVLGQALITSAVESVEGVSPQRTVGDQQIGSPGPPQYPSVLFACAPQNVIDTSPVCSCLSPFVVLHIKFGVVPTLNLV